jgi:drug/metabolite transporter (DMT)-like permease
MSSTTPLRGRLLLLLVALMWSISGVVVKSPPLEELPESQRGPLIACGRALFAAAFLLPFLRRRAIRFRRPMLPMVIGFSAMNLLFITAVIKTTAAAAIFLQYTSSGWAFLLGWLFLKERIDRANLLALLAAACGIFWIVAADLSSDHLAGNLIALVSGFSYSVVIVSLRALREENAVWLIVLNHLVSGLILLPWVLTFDVSLNGSQWALIGILGVFQIAIPYVLFARALRFVTAQEAALLTLIEPILNPLWVWLFWREAVPFATWAGGSLILGGLAIRYLWLMRKGPAG